MNCTMRNRYIEGYVIRFVIAVSLAVVLWFPGAGISGDVSAKDCTSYSKRSLPDCVESEILGQIRDGYRIKSTCKLPVLIAITFEGKDDLEFYLSNNQVKEKRPTLFPNRFGRFGRWVPAGAKFSSVKSVQCCSKWSGEKWKESYCANYINGPVGSKTEYEKICSIPIGPPDAICWAYRRYSSS